MSLDSYLQRDARLRIEIKVKLAELIRLGNAEKLRLAMKHHGYTVELRLRSGSVQNLAHERDTLRISFRFDRKVSPETFGLVKDSVDDRPGSSNLGGLLEKAIKDKSRAACDLLGHDVPGKQPIQAGPQLLQKAMQGNPRKRICVQHFEDVGRRLLTGENDRAVSQIWEPSVEGGHHGTGRGDRKSTRLNSSHSSISYAVFCLKKKKKQKNTSSFIKKKKKKTKYVR